MYLLYVFGSHLDNMIQDHKTSFVISLIFFFLLPIFFIPGGLLGLEVAKSTLFLLMTSIVSMVFLYEVWRARQVVIPWHPLILVVLFLPLVYALSAFLSTSALLSLLGYYLEIGTSGFIFLSAVLLILVSTIFFKTSRVFYALITFLVSIATIFLLVVVKILLGFSTLINVDNLFVLGNFFGNLANPLGNWTDLAVMSGLLSIVTALALAMLPMKRVVKVSLYFIFLLGVFILIVSNFSVALILTSVLSFVLLLYFTIVEKKFLSTDETLSSRAQYFLLRSTFLPVVLVVLTLVTFINPTLSDTRGTLNDVLTNTFKVKNIDVRPSFSATLSVSKEVLYKEGLLGSGPNTFGRDWLVYKPVDINATPFWEVTFPFGVGFIPTQIASTGLLGSLLWLLFLFFIVVLSVKSLSHMPKVGVERFVLTSVLFITVSLWVSNLFYTPSSTMLILAFVFSGMFIAMNVQIGTIPTRILNLQKSSVVSFSSLFQ
jgi:hypothetical protein